MTHMTSRSHRVPTVAFLLLALTITTGWTPAGASTRMNDRAAGVATQPVDGLALSHGTATSRRLAIAAASRTADLAAHQISEAALDLSARTLFQARLAAAQAPAPKAAPVKAKAPAAKAKAPVAKASTTTYSGTNHFWFPALGISKAVHLFPCSRQTPPGEYLYRWGCAGKNNVYLMGHASGVLRRLHDAYLGGRLKVGMLAKYADANGRVRTYRVTSWRVVDPTNSSWAIASQPVPSMTIQTCIGLRRLNVRLVVVN